MPRPSLLLTIAFCFSFASCQTRELRDLPPTTDAVSPAAININTASREELKAIPHVGEKLAEKIIFHRETHGPFRRREHLMLIPGISDERFRKIKVLVKVE